MENRVARVVCSFPTAEQEPAGDFPAPANRPISTTIHVPPPLGHPGIGGTVEIDPEQLRVRVLYGRQKIQSG